MGFVSIPLWFDSYLFRPNKFFQHKFVSIPLWFDSYRSSWDNIKYYTRVSIPLWFDSYQEEEKKKLFDSVSQFHYGSIHTGIVAVREQLDKFVSIPLWFDSYERILLD